jgi:hypothetical protein
VEGAQLRAASHCRRLRLRDLLRTVIEEAGILIVPRGSHRFAAVQLFFREGAHRDYVIHYRAAGYCREGGWEAKSARFAAGKGRSPELDLRQPDHVKRLQAVLKALELD